MKFIELSKNLTLKKLTSLLILVGIAFVGCDVNNSEDSNGKLRISLTDAPGDYAAVNIEVEQVLVKNADDDTTSWEVIYDGNMMINLLDYQNGEMLTLGEAELETGIYDEMRLVLGDDNSLELLGGAEVALNTPSAQTSGFKIKINSTVEADQVTDLAIDFDAARSIVARGNGSFNLKPVLRVIEVDDAGSISGNIAQAEANAWVYTVMGTDTVSTVADTEGDFTLYGLDEGNYDINISATSGAFADTVITNVDIEQNEHFEFESSISLEAILE